MNSLEKTSTKPVPKDDIYGDDRWMCMHKRFLIEAKVKEPDVVFIGDSVVALAAHSDIWEKYFISMHCLNFGISDDKTQNVLWRIENGELDNCCPKIVVLSIGSNNHEDTVDDIADGIIECTKAIVSHQPTATVIVLKLLPCGLYPNPLREKFAKVNDKIDTALSEISLVQLLNVDPGFVNHDQTISHHDLYDYFHLSRNAYLRAFEPLADLLQELLGGDHSESAIARALD